MMFEEQKDIGLDDALESEIASWLTTAIQDTKTARSAKELISEDRGDDESEDSYDTLRAERSFECDVESG